MSTRLRRAIHLNDLLLVSRIIRTHPRSIQNVDVADKGNSSLHLAARLGRVKIVVPLPPSSEHTLSLPRYIADTSAADPGMPLRGRP